METFSYTLRPSVSGLLMTTLWTLTGISFGEYSRPVSMEVALERHNSYIYFLSSRRHIKIGYATCVNERIRSIQSMSPVPLELLGVFPGGIETEREIHARFSGLRLHGEWFIECPEIYRFINSVCKYES